MRKKNIKPLIISALLAVGFGATSVGTTFALFTDNANTSINVTAGIVDVEQTVKFVRYDSSVDNSSHVFAENEKSFTNTVVGTTFNLVNNTITINKMVPGDKITLELTTLNKSNVKIKTRLKTTHTTTTEVDLFDALDIHHTAVDGNNADITNEVFRWREKAESTDLVNGVLMSKVTITIEFPNDDNLIRAREEGENNHYQNANCMINLAQEAVQANAEVTSLIDALNAKLAAQEERNYTFHDALSDVETVAELDEITSNGFLYNVVDDRFYMSEEVNDNFVNYFKAYSALPAKQKYSIYATDGWTTTAVDGLTVGFDVGNNDDITSISYVRPTGPAQSVTIRTNGGLLNVNAPGDTLKHYGTAEHLNIEAINSSSYHEYGTINHAQIKTGRVVIENSEASIDNLLLVGKPNKSGFEEIIVETKAGAEFPTFDRTDVNIAPEGTLVVNVVTPETNEYIYLLKAGVVEQIVVTEEKKNDVSEDAANVTTKDEATQTVAEQVANVGKKNAEGTSYVDSNGNDIALENLTSENIVIEEEKATQEEIAKGENLFSGGAGTESNPYIISDEREWEKLCVNTGGDLWLSGYHYSIINDLDFGDIEGNFSIGLFTGSLDFNGHSMKNLTSAKAGNTYRYSNWSLIYGIVGEVEIKNLDFYVYTEQNTHYSWLVRYTYGAVNELTLDDVDIFGTQQCADNNVATYVYFLYGDNKDTVNFIDCDNYATIINNEGFSGIFVGGLYRVPDVELSFKNCNNRGELYGLNGSSAMLISNPTQYSGHAFKCEVENCTNYGKITGTKGTEYLVASGMPGELVILSDEERAAYETAGKLKKAEGSVFSVIETSKFGTANGKYDPPVVEGADHYAVTFSFSALSGSNGGVVDYTFELAPSALKSVNAYGWIDITEVPNQEDIEEIYIGTTKFYVYNGKYVFNSTTIHYYDDPVTVSFVAFDAQDRVLGYSVYSETL